MVGNVFEEDFKKWLKLGVHEKKLSWLFILPNKIKQCKAMMKDGMVR